MRWLFSGIPALGICLFLGAALASTGEVVDTEKLNSWYNGYNEKYFQKELPIAGNLEPPEVIIDAHLSDPDKMGATVFGARDGFIHLGLNPFFNRGTKTLRLTILHEMCHIQMFVEEVHIFNDHGPEWQGCMVKLANQGAMGDLW